MRDAALEIISDFPVTFSIFKNKTKYFRLRLSYEAKNAERESLKRPETYLRET